MSLLTRHSGPILFHTAHTFSITEVPLALVVWMKGYLAVH